METANGNYVCEGFFSGLFVYILGCFISSFLYFLWTIKHHHPFLPSSFVDIVSGFLKRKTNWCENLWSLWSNWTVADELNQWIVLILWMTVRFCGCCSVLELNLNTKPNMPVVYGGNNVTNNLKNTIYLPVKYKINLVKQWKPALKEQNAATTVSDTNQYNETVKRRTLRHFTQA